MLRLYTYRMLLLCLLLGSTSTTMAQAGMPELVGVLQVVLEDEVAKQLELNDSQREAIQKIVDERETAGLSEALKVKDATPEERTQALAPFRDETVRQGLKVLTDEQRTKLAALDSVKSNPLYALPSAEGAKPVEPMAEATAEPDQGEDRPRREFGRRGDRGDDQRSGNNRSDEQSEPRKSESVGIAADADGNLTFNFRYQAWEDVIDWFAQQSDLSLLMDAPPQGTFNYTDSKKYTPAEALDVLNSVLLTKGYTLVRKGRMLFVVNLEDEIPPNLVTDVPVNELDKRGEYELVRTLFQVRTMTAPEAAAEIEKLIGPQGNVVVLDRAGMIQVTETAGRLRTIRSVISAVEGPSGAINESPQLEVYSISGSDPAAVLAVLQTLMEKQPGVRLATDPQTGNLIALARPSEHFTIRATIAQMQQDARRIEVIPLRAVDPQTAVLAINKLFKQNTGEDADPTAPKVDADLGTRTLLVRASPSQLEQIEALLQKMGESGRDESGDYVSSGGNVRLIPLSGSAAQTAISQIERIWPALRSNPIRIVNQHAEIPEIRPGDSGANLEGADWQRRLIDMLPNNLPSGESDGQAVPIGPTTPRGAIQPAVRPQSEKSERSTQQSTNRVRASFAQLQQPSEPLAEPTVDEPPVSEKQAAPSESPKSKTGAPIIIAPGPGGTMIASEDIEALDELERLLTASAGPSGSGNREYAVFYLKYAKAAAAAEILGQIFGTSSSGGGGGGSLMGDIAGAALGDVGGGLVGDLLGINGTSSSSGFLAGTVEIVPDVRLNALIVNARPNDLDLIDRLLRILDQRTGPETVEAGGRPRLIPLYHTEASEVAEIVRQVFADRLQSAGGQGGQPSPEDILRMLGRGRGGPGGGGGGGEAEKVEKMSIGIDERNNALVVRAPDPLFLEVEALAQQLDQEQLDNAQSTRIVTLKHSNPDAVRQALTTMLGENVTTSTTTAQDFNRGRDGGGDRGQSEDFARRMEFFRRMREASEQGGGGGPGGPGGGFPGGGDRGGDRGGRGGDRGGGDRGGGDRGGRGDRGR